MKTNKSKKPTIKPTRARQAKAPAVAKVNSQAFEYWQLIAPNLDGTLQIAVPVLPANEAEQLLDRYNTDRSPGDPLCYLRPIALSWRYIDQTIQTASDGIPRYSRNNFEVVIVDETMENPRRTIISNVSFE